MRPLGRNVVKQRKSRKSIFNKEKISKLFKKVGSNKGKPNQVIGKKGKRKQKIKIIVLIIAGFVLFGCAIFAFVMHILFAPKEDEISLNNTTSILEMANDYQGHWAEEQIVSLVKQGLMTGTSSVTLDPDGKVTRAQFVIMLYKLDKGRLPIIDEKIVLFEDVLDNFYYTDAINWASSNDLVNGISSSEFIPNYLVTRQQALTILYEYFRKVNDNGIDYSSFKLPYTDGYTIQNYATLGVKWAFANNIIDFWGYEKLEPFNELTRAELATIIYNYIEKFQKG